MPEKKSTSTGTTRKKKPDTSANLGEKKKQTLSEAVAASDTRAVQSMSEWFDDEIGTIGSRFESVLIEFQGRKLRVRYPGNLVLNELSLDEIKTVLNRLPGKIAFWKTLRADAEEALAQAEDRFEEWWSVPYSMAVEVCENRAAAATIKSKALTLEGVKDDYAKRRDDIQSLKTTISKVGGILEAYITQSFTLGRIADLTGKELSNLEPRLPTGRSNMGNM